MEIRPMTLADYDDVYALWLACPGMGLNNLDDSQEGIARFLRRNPDTCFVALADGCIVGVIMAGNDGRRGYIYHTAVHPRWQRRGIATALVDRTMAALKACGINKAALVVFARNADGNAFWEKLGFTVRTDLTYRNREINAMIRKDT